MAIAPTPAEIFRRAVEEGERRLDQSMLELVSTSFIAGFTIIFGIVALGIVETVVEPRFGEIAHLAGALAFAPGLVFLVIGRAELFTENFFDPTATVFDRRDAGLIPRLLRLWGITFALNIIGGALFALTLLVPGVLPAGTGDTLSRIAEERAANHAWADFVSGIIGGALVSLLTYLLQAVNGVGSRIGLSYVVGFLIALGPFNHVIVTGLHVLVGMMFGAPVSLSELGTIMLLSTAGNLVGGVGLVTLSHVAQARGQQEEADR